MASTLLAMASTRGLRKEQKGLNLKGSFKKGEREKERESVYGGFVSEIGTKIGSVH